MVPREDPPGVAVMEVLDDGTTTTTTTTAPTTTTTAPPTPPPPAPAAVVPPVDEVVVAPGDSFWSLAVEVVADGRTDRPADREVVGYWQRLMDANRLVLADADNPDLLFPGQTLTLPPA